MQSSAHRSVQIQNFIDGQFVEQLREISLDNIEPGDW